MSQLECSKVFKFIKAAALEIVFKKYISNVYISIRELSTTFACLDSFGKTIRMLKI